jgi:hypothetical protein
MASVVAISTSDILCGIIGLFAVVLGHATAPVSRADINGAIA